MLTVMNKFRMRYVGMDVVACGLKKSILPLHGYGVEHFLSMSGSILEPKIVEAQGALHPWPDYSFISLPYAAVSSILYTK